MASAAPETARAATMWWNPFTVERATLRTRLSPDECGERIRAHIFRFWNARIAEGPLRGTANGRRFLLTRNLHGNRNGFQPVARGEMRADAAGGAMITLRLSLHPMARVWWSFMLLAFSGFLGLTLAGTIWQIASGGPHLAQPLTLLIGTLVVGAVIYAFYTMAFSFVRGDRDYLVEQLRTLLDASVTRGDNT